VVVVGVGCCRRECRMMVGVQRRKEGRRKTRVLGSGWNVTNVVVAISF